MSDMDFERMLAKYHENLKTQYDDAEEYSDWMPPDGEYIVTVLKCSKGVSTKKDPNNPMFWWKPTVRIEDVAREDLNGQEFALGFFNTNAFGFMKGQVKALNGGNAVGYDEIDGVFMASVGKVLRVKVATTTSKKNDKEYTNCYVQEIIPMTAAEETEVEPPQRVAGALGTGDCPEGLIEDNNSDT